MAKYHTRTSIRHRRIPSDRRWIGSSMVITVHFAFGSVPLLYLAVLCCILRHLHGVVGFDFNHGRDLLGELWSGLEAAL